MSAIDYDVLARRAFLVRYGGTYSAIPSHPTLNCNSREDVCPLAASVIVDPRPAPRWVRLARVSAARYARCYDA